MKSMSLLLATLLLATNSFALEINDHSNKGGNASATQGQNQGQAQLQGQAQGQGQAQLTNVAVSNRISNDVRNNAASFAAGGESSARSNSNSASNSGGNSQSVVVTDSGKMEYSGKYEVKNVPSVFSGNVYPTSPCMGSSTVGGAGVGFGFSVGTSWKDDECGIRETSRSFSGLGLKDDALAILCSSAYAAAAPSCAQYKSVKE